MPRLKTSERLPITWLILLRGINVGGKRPVAMADLRELFAEMGYVDPATYIQSGNVIVGSHRARSSRTVPTIERRLTERVGHDQRIVLHDFTEMEAIVRGIPSDWDPEDRSMRCHVIFLTEDIVPVEVLSTLRPKPGLESVSAGPHAEMTVRNLNTTLKLHALMQERA